MKKSHSVRTAPTENATATIARTMRTHSTNEPHSGASTHHHDQSIVFVSFRVIKTIASSPAKPRPPPDDVDVLYMVGLMLEEVRGREIFKMMSCCRVIGEGSIILMPENPEVDTFIVYSDSRLPFPGMSVPGDPSIRRGGSGGF